MPGLRILRLSNVVLIISFIKDYMRTILSTAGIRSPILRLCCGPGSALCWGVGWRAILSSNGFEAGDTDDVSWKQGSNGISGMSSPSQQSLFLFELFAFALYVDGIGTI